MKIIGFLSILALNVTEIYSSVPRETNQYEYVDIMDTIIKIRTIDEYLKSVEDQSQEKPYTLPPNWEKLGMPRVDRDVRREMTFIYHGKDTRNIEELRSKAFEAAGARFTPLFLRTTTPVSGPDIFEETTPMYEEIPTGMISGTTTRGLRNRDRQEILDLKRKIFEKAGARFTPLFSLPTTNAYYGFRYTMPQKTYLHQH